MAVQNPLTALADDVDAVTRALNHQAHPVVLVGHDYGGTVITQAGRHQTVAALVYIAACAPDIGESTTMGNDDCRSREVTRHGHDIRVTSLRLYFTATPEACSAPAAVSMSAATAPGFET